MFLQYYGLREQPFGVTPNPRFLYHGPAHREALASLIYGIEADLGFAALIAEPGMGKTTLLFYLLEKFRPTARTALVFQTQCTPQELLRYVANEFEIEAAEDDPVVLNDRIRQALVREARARRRVILIVDEAQNLTEESLEAIRLLSDFETPDFKLLHIILAGQPRLAEKLAQPGLAQLLQRIAMLNRLLPFTAIDDVARYIAYRLKVAGYSGLPLFTTEAMELIARHSGGIPRQINRLCFNALSLGCVTKKRRIDGEVVREVIKDLDVNSLLPRSASNPADCDEEPSGKDSAGLRMGPLRVSGSSRLWSQALSQSPSQAGQSPQPIVAPDKAATVVAPATAIAEGTLALSPEPLMRAKTERVEPSRATASEKGSARPRVVSTSATQPKTEPLSANSTSPTNRAATATFPTLHKYAAPRTLRSSGRVSLAWIVICVIAVPLLVLVAVRYAEHQRLLPGWEQTVPPPSSGPAPDTVENGKTTSAPTANPDSSEKPKRPPTSQLKPGLGELPGVWMGTQPSFGSIEIFVQS
jgi:general secretion pathway protein A